MVARPASVLFVSLLLTAPAANAQSYELVLLGGGGDQYALPAAINGAGDVSGSLAPAESGAFRPVLWSGGAQIVLADDVTFGIAWDVNEDGDIVGIHQSLAPDGTTISHAALWRDGLRVDLEPPGTAGFGTGISDAGEAIGNFRAAGSAASVAFRWFDGSLTTLPDLGPGAGSQPFDVNEAGVIAGISYAPTGRAVKWGPDHAIEALPELPGTTWSTATAVNASDVIVGQAMAAGGFRAVRWEGGTVTDLGTLGGSYAAAGGINASGAIVGTSHTAAAVPHAFLWFEGAIVDLNDLIAGDSGCVLHSASDINDAGQIAASGVCPGDGPLSLRAFRLDPPSPTALERLAALSERFGVLGLPAGLLKSLRAKIDAARAALERGAIRAADNQLGALANQVTAQRGKAIAPADADAILTEIAAIRTQLAG